ncbi:hypothetical protein BRARA_C01414 [Brassica rapa]|uniref:Uncharacterized protein n=1 Tax=Brassica campestris TaxID=3711 RepID=A0A397ZVX0_BRACM|nr:hypothetical protein BRARA_C01414 [Brassica rapa]
MGEEEKCRGESRETEVPGRVGVRDECCRKFRGQKPKTESDLETHQSLIFGHFAWSFYGLRLRYSK